MSYNEAQDAGFTYKEFTINDLKALGALWGLEGGHSSPLATRVPFPTADQCDFPDVEAVPYLTSKLPGQFTSKGDDYLVANTINANIYGGDGDDTLIGSKGRDTLVEVMVMMCWMVGLWWIIFMVMTEKITLL